VSDSPIEPSEEMIVTAHRLAVLHRRSAVPTVNLCLWCGEDWPCRPSTWAERILADAGDGV
jgi:hypothetical protein